MVQWLPGFYTRRLAKGRTHHCFDLLALETEAAARRVIIGAFIILSIFWQLEQTYSQMARLAEERHVGCIRLWRKGKSTLSDRRVKEGSHSLQDKAREVAGRRQVRGIDTSSPSHMEPGSRIKSRELYLGRWTLSGGPGMSLMVEL